VLRIKYCAIIEVVKFAIGVLILLRLQEIKIHISLERGDTLVKTGLLRARRGG
jgi:hypothetical protein